MIEPCTVLCCAVVGGCDGPQCPPPLTPADRRITAQEEAEKKARAAREKERMTLHEELEKHQENLNKIEHMSRALRYQYAELRRQHMV